MDEPLTQICDAIHGVLEKTPPELAADTSNTGIIITGGGALMYGIDKRVNARTGIEVTIAEDPMSCVAVGTGKALDHIDLIQKNDLNRKKRRFI